MRQHNRFHYGRVADAHAVVHFKAFLEAAQDGNGVFHRRFFNHDRLEAPFESRVLFNILAVFVHRCSADAVQFATRQHGLEQVARVHCAFGFARTHNGVQFVNEKDGLAFALFHLIKNGLEAFFKFATVLGAGDKRTHIKGEKLAAFQAFGHVALDDTKGKAFHNGRLANARLTNKNRVVLGAARKNANDAADLGVTANNRVHLALTRGFHKITGVFVQRLKGVFGVGARYARAAAQFFHRRHKARTGNFVFLEHLAKRRGGRYLCQGRKEVVNADVFVLHAFGFVLGVSQYLGQALRNHDFCGVHARAGNRRALAQRAFNGNGKGTGLHAHLVQNAGDDAVFLLGKSQSQMFDIRFLMAHTCGKALSLADSFTRFFCELVNIHMDSSDGATPLWAGKIYFIPGAVWCCTSSLTVSSRASFQRSNFKVKLLQAEFHFLFWPRIMRVQPA